MEQSAIMGVLQVNLSEIAIKGSTVVPLKIEKREAGIGISMVLPHRLGITYSMDSAEEQKPEANPRSDAELKSFTDEMDEEYTRKRYTAQDIADGLKKIKYKATSESYVHKAVLYGFVIPPDGTTLSVFIQWIKDNGFKCPNR